MDGVLWNEMREREGRENGETIVGVGLTQTS